MSHRRRQHIRRSEHGQAAVEFALVAPILLLLLPPWMMDSRSSIVFHNYLAVTDAARAAERQAIEARISSGVRVGIRRSRPGFL